MSYETILSPNRSSRNGKQVEGIILHYTAGGSLNSSVRWMCNQVKIKNPENYRGRKYMRNGEAYYNSLASAHYIVGRNGKVIMLVPENMKAWHSGSGTTTPTLNGRKHLNRWTIGIEICNWGPLYKKNGVYYTNAGNFSYRYRGNDIFTCPKQYQAARNWKDSNGDIVFPDGVVEHWEPYTEEQIDSVIKLLKEIVGRYNILCDWVAGHEDVDPTRKCDPGPAFPWDKIKREVFPIVMSPEAPMDENKETEEELLYSDYHEDRSDTGLLDKLFKWPI